MAKWNLIYWIEADRGGSIIRVLAFLLLITLVTLLVVFWRFEGPSSEKTFEELTLAKSLAQGHGFTTTVRHPQAVQFEIEKERAPLIIDSRYRVPDLYNAPFYPIVLGAMYKVLPDSYVFSPSRRVEARPSGYRADYAALFLNIGFFWATCLLVYWLARRLFSVRVGIVSVLALVLSAGVWDGVLDVSGTSLLMLLLTLTFLIWSFLESAHARQPFEKPVSRGMVIYAGILGLLMGLMFLTEYSAGFVLLAFGIYLLVKFRFRGMAILFNVALVGFLIVSLPWVVRNLSLTQHPMALAGHELVQTFRTDETVVNTYKFALETEPPAVQVRAIAAKGFTGLREFVSEDLWVSGAYFFVAFFLSALLYQFRDQLAHRLFVGALIVGGILLVLPPFFDNGIGTRSPAAYLTPLFILFGSGFLFILIESVREREAWSRLALIILVVSLHAFPLVRNFFEVRRQHFTWPPYLPVAMALVSEQISGEFERIGFGLMSDLPAGVGWYMNRPVWGQPNEYLDFTSVQLLQETGALILTPHRLDEPYFQELAKLPPFDQDLLPNRGWHDVYRGLAEGSAPRYFPLPSTVPLTSNMLMLTR